MAAVKPVRTGISLTLTLTLTHTCKQPVMCRLGFSLMAAVKLARTGSQQANMLQHEAAMYEERKEKGKSTP